MPGTEHGSEPGRARRWLAVAAERFGFSTFPLALGAVLGFYFADQGMRWLPTMAGGVLALLVLGFLCLAASRLLAGRVWAGEAARRRLRLSVVVFLTLATAGVGARLLVYWMTEPSPLTALPRAEIDLAFQLDSARYRQMDEQLDRSLSYLERWAHQITPASDELPSADQERLLLDAWRMIYESAFALDLVRVYYEDWFRFDPSRAEHRYHLQSFLLTYAAELSLYEKALRIVRVLGDNKHVAKFLDCPHPERGLPEHTFSFFRQEFLGARDRSRVLAGEQYLLWLDKGLDSRQRALGYGCSWLWDRIERHLAVIESSFARQETRLGLDADLQVLKRAVRRVWFPAQSAVAEWMGDQRVRRIGHYLVSRAQQEALDADLQPGDILLARKNWYLSNVGLPGFWPHAILYIGAPEKLEAFFDDPAVRSFVQERSGRPLTLGEYISQQHPMHWAHYRAGHGGDPIRVIEAVSEGVVLNSLPHVTGDYVAALRPRLDKLARAHAILTAFGYLGRPYDFDFDFATDHSLVCTELVWRAYRPRIGKAGLNMPLTDLMGRKTLPANDIARLYAAERGRPDAQLDFVAFLDACEKDGRAFVSDEQAFSQTPERTKWDVALK
ncbi:MAG: hypothetical protein JXR96_10375 [Deltaproteobacteria bacterium]|nr:hypothetical protein [Deltaproteobacteria bacterium]